MEPMVFFGFLVVGWLVTLAWCLNKLAKAFIELQVRLWERDN
jgi:hypothetical protein